MKTIEAEAENDDEEKTKEKGEPPASSSPLSPVQRGTLSSCSSSITSPWPAVKEFLWLRARQLFRTSGRLLATLAMALIILALYGLGNSDVAQILEIFGIFFLFTH